MDIADDADLDDKEKEAKIIQFFNRLEKAHFYNKSNEEIANDIIESFEDRQTQTLVIKFPITEKISTDALHPQLMKTIESICEKLDEEEFSVFKYAYWTDEVEFVIFTIELNVFKQGKYYIHKGPKVWPKQACDNFKGKWGDALYPLDEYIVLTRERQCKTAKEFIDYILDEASKLENIAKSKEISEELKGKILGLMFFEPSTRTRISFETAMKRFNGQCIGFASSDSSSVSKGESIADTAKMFEAYSDALVIRHELEGVSKFISDLVDVPVIKLSWETLDICQ